MTNRKLGQYGFAARASIFGLISCIQFGTLESHASLPHFTRFAVVVKVFRLMFFILVKPIQTYIRSIFISISPKRKTKH